MVTKIPTQLWLPGRVVVVTRTVKRKAEGVIVGIHRVPMVKIIQKKNREDFVKKNTDD
jgi:hypothetical protein